MTLPPEDHDLIRDLRELAPVPAHEPDWEAMAREIKRQCDEIAAKPAHTLLTRTLAWLRAKRTVAALAAACAAAAAVALWFQLGGEPARPVDPPSLDGFVGVDQEELDELVDPDPAADGDLDLGPFGEPSYAWIDDLSDDEVRDIDAYLRTAQTR